MRTFVMEQMSDFTVEIEGKTLPIIELDGTGMSVGHAVDLVGYDGPARFTLTRNGRTWVGEIGVKAVATTDGIRLKPSGPEGERQRFVSVLNWYAGRTPSFLGDLADTVAVAEGPHRSQRRNISAAFGLGVLSLGLIFAISEIFVQRALSTTSRVAYITTPGKEFDANTAGKLVFVKTDGRVEKGEFFAALKTSHDFPKFLEASSSGNVSAQAISPNDYVRKGTPVIRVSEEGAVPHVVAFVRLSDAVTALNSPQALVEFPKSGSALSIPQGSMSYVNSNRVMTDDDGKSLAEIKLRLPEGVDIPTDEAVVVKFGRPVGSLALVPRQWLSILSSLLS